jgi:hypothetical protein
MSFSKTRDERLSAVCGAAATGSIEFSLIKEEELLEEGARLKLDLECEDAEARFRAEFKALELERKTQRKAIQSECKAREAQLRAELAKAQAKVQAMRDVVVAAIAETATTPPAAGAAATAPEVVPATPPVAAALMPAPASILMLPPLTIPETPTSVTVVPMADADAPTPVLSPILVPLVSPVPVARFTDAPAAVVLISPPREIVPPTPQTSPVHVQAQAPVVAAAASVAPQVPGALVVSQPSAKAKAKPKTAAAVAKAFNRRVDTAVGHCQELLAELKKSPASTVWTYKGDRKCIPECVLTRFADTDLLGACHKSRLPVADIRDANSVLDDSHPDRLIAAAVAEKLADAEAKALAKADATDSSESDGDDGDSDTPVVEPPLKRARITPGRAEMKGLLEGYLMWATQSTEGEKDAAKLLAKTKKQKQDDPKRSQTVRDAVYAYFCTKKGRKRARQSLSEAFDYTVVRAAGASLGIAPAAAASSSS